MVGRMVLLFAVLMLVPLGFALWPHDAAEDAFVTATLVTFMPGLAMSAGDAALPPRTGAARRLPAGGPDLAVLPVFGALPLWLAMPGLSSPTPTSRPCRPSPPPAPRRCRGLDDLPLSVNVWRCFMMFVGGLGIIVLAVAILPMLGVGGSQLFKAEVTGPLKDQKLTPRIADTARVIWLDLRRAGGGLLLRLPRRRHELVEDAFMHMCTTVSLGGFSSYDASFGHWDSPLIEGWRWSS
jgi:trk system potassium uptake protein